MEPRILTAVSNEHKVRKHERVLVTGGAGESNLQWCIADLCDQEAVRAAVKEFRPHAIFHLAAESHVDYLRALDLSSG